MLKRGIIMVLDDELKISLQDVGARLLVSELEKVYGEVEIEGNTHEYCLVRAEIAARPVLIYTRTVVYPTNYEQALDESMPEFKQILENYDSKVYGGKLKNYDVYAVVIGVVQKYVETEKEKGRFYIGGKYAASFSRIRLIRKAETDSLGYSMKNPLPVDDISCEYAMLRHAMADKGVIITKNRYGSCRGDNGHILDQWNINVMSENGIFVFSYDIFFDPYAEMEESCLTKLFGKEFGFWKMPQGFSSYWIAQNVPGTK